MSKRSLCASLQGQKLLRKVLERLNMTQKSLVNERGIASWSTVNRFFNGKPIERQLFIEICEKLNISWEDVAQFPQEDLETTPLLKIWSKLIAIAIPTEDMGLILARTYATVTSNGALRAPSA